MPALPSAARSRHRAGRLGSSTTTSAPNEAMCSLYQPSSVKLQLDQVPARLAGSGRLLSACRRRPCPAPAPDPQQAVRGRAAPGVPCRGPTARTSVPGGTVTEPAGPVKLTGPSIRLSRNTRCSPRSLSRPTTYQRPRRFTTPHGSSLRCCAALRPGGPVAERHRPPVPDRLPQRAERRLGRLQPRLDARLGQVLGLDPGRPQLEQRAFGRARPARPAARPGRPGPRTAASSGSSLISGSS